MILTRAACVAWQISRFSAIRLSPALGIVGFCVDPVMHREPRVTPLKHALCEPDCQYTLGTHAVLKCSANLTASADTVRVGLAAAILGKTALEQT